MNAFAAALDVLLADVNLGVDITYQPAAGAPITCRGAFTTPDQDAALGPEFTRRRDRKRALVVRQSDIPSPAKNATVTIAAAGFRVIDFSSGTPQRLSWRLELAPL